MDLQWTLTIGELLAVTLPLLIATFSSWRTNRKPKDGVLLAWQLRSTPIVRGGKQVESSRFWGEDVQNPHRFKLAIVNVGVRDIEINEQFPVLNSDGTKLFSVELVGPEATTFVRVMAEREQLDGGGGVNPNRWDSAPFYLSVGQALTVEGVTSGRARSALFYNLKNARYLKRIGWRRRAIWVLVLGSLLTGASWVATRVGLNRWALLVVSLIGAMIFVRGAWRAYATDRRLVWWSRVWSAPPMDIPEEIPRPPEGVKLFLQVRFSDYGPTGRTLLIENEGLATAMDVVAHVRSPSEGIVLEVESGGFTEIKHGHGLELAFTQWVDETHYVQIEVQWRVGDDEYRTVKRIEVP